MKLNDLPLHHFKCICADPPWHFKCRTALQMSDWKNRRDVEKHYNVMCIDDICAMPIRDLAAKDSHLFIWTTGPCLRSTFDVIEAWGFRYSAVAFTWIKLKRTHGRQISFLASNDIENELHVGLGLTTRKNAEFCLLARRGGAKREAKNVREIIMAPVREHSRKPDEAYDRMEKYCVGPYLDLFARQTRKNWWAIGDEIDKFKAAE